jgi:ASCH domain-containing protein
MTGLVIKSPWIDPILSGDKTWEIRGRNTAIRGSIALIKSKSGMVVGTCDVVDCIGPLSLDELRSNYQRHSIALECSMNLLIPRPSHGCWQIRSASIRRFHIAIHLAP